MFNFFFFTYDMCIMLNAWEFVQGLKDLININLKNVPKNIGNFYNLCQNLNIKFL